MPGRGVAVVGLKGVQCGWSTVGEGESFRMRLRDRQGHGEGLAFYSESKGKPLSSFLAGA